MEFQGTCKSDFKKGNLSVEKNNSQVSQNSLSLKAAFNMRNKNDINDKIKQIKNFLI